MATGKETIGDLILKDVCEGKELASRTPAVLSCGGIYIPHRGHQHDVLYQIITTPSRTEPVKVVTGAAPRSFLQELLMKESLN